MKVLDCQRLPEKEGFYDFDDIKNHEGKLSFKENFTTLNITHATNLAASIKELREVKHPLRGFLDLDQDGEKAIEITSGRHRLAAVEMVNKEAIEIYEEAKRSHKANLHILEARVISEQLSPAEYDDLKSQIQKPVVPRNIAIPLKLEVVSKSAPRSINSKIWDFLENISQQNLHYLAEAEYIKRLIDDDVDPGFLIASDKTKYKSRRSLTRLIRVAELPQELKEEVVRRGLNKTKGMSFAEAWSSFSSNEKENRKSIADFLAKYFDEVKTVSKEAKEKAGATSVNKAALSRLKSKASLTDQQIAIILEELPKIISR